LSSGKLALRAGSEEYEFEVRGADEAHWALNMILSGMLR
jgi:hypothetical protein